MYSDDNNTNKHISKSEDSILNLATIDNPLHNSPLLKYNSKYDFDKRILFSKSKESPKYFDDMLFNQQEDEHKYIFHDTNDNPSDIFNINKESSPEYETPEMKMQSPLNLKLEDMQVQQANIKEMESALIFHKQNRIEQLIDRMHTLIDTKNIILIRNASR